MIDIVTVVAGDDLNNIQNCILSLNKHLEIRNIFVITNEPEKVPLYPNVVSIDESLIISKDRVDIARRLEVSFFPDRFNWYFQQFLKMEFSRSKYCNGNYIIWDADTVLLRPIDFYEEEKVLFTVGNESLHMPYVESYQSLLGIERGLSFSMISQHMVVDRSVMIELIDQVESKFDEGFMFSVLNNLEGTSNCLFSEYETYTNYFITRFSSSSKIIERNWFRNAAAICGFDASLDDLEKFFPNTDYVALEKFDIGFKRKLIGWLRYSKYRIVGMKK